MAPNCTPGQPRLASATADRGRVAGPTGNARPSRRLFWCEVPRRHYRGRYYNLVSGTLGRCKRCGAPYVRKQGRQFCDCCSRDSRRPVGVTPGEAQAVADDCLRLGWPVPVVVAAASLGLSVQMLSRITVRALESFRVRWREMYGEDGCPLG